MPVLLPDREMLAQPLGPSKDLPRLHLKYLANLINYCLPRPLGGQLPDPDTLSAASSCYRFTHPFDRMHYLNAYLTTFLRFRLTCCTNFLIHGFVLPLFITINRFDVAVLLCARRIVCDAPHRPIPQRVPCSLTRVLASLRSAQSLCCACTQLCKLLLCQ